MKVDRLHRAMPVKHTDEGLRGLSGISPIRPESVQKYLEGKLGDALEGVSNAMPDLAENFFNRGIEIPSHTRP